MPSRDEVAERIREAAELRLEVEGVRAAS